MLTSCEGLPSPHPTCMELTNCRYKGAQLTHHFTAARQETLCGGQECLKKGTSWRSGRSIESPFGEEVSAGLPITRMKHDSGKGRHNEKEVLLGS